MVAAIRFFEDVNNCMNENCIVIRHQYWSSFQSLGGRSEGITAFYGNDANIYITVYEHWNTDQIDIKVTQYPITHLMHDNHDTPDVQLGSTDRNLSILIVQMLLVRYFEYNINEYYVPYEGYKGITTAHKNLVSKAQSYVDKLFNEVIEKWSE